jgi:hypothetical protein
MVPQAIGVVGVEGARDAHGGIGFLGAGFSSSSGGDPP